MENRNNRDNMPAVVLKAGIAAVAVTFSLFGLANYSKKVDCDITTSHAHIYESTGGYVRYIARENEKHDNYSRTDDYIIIDGEEQLYKFLEKHDLMPIAENLDIILEVQKQKTDFTEYRYSYDDSQKIYYQTKVGKSTTTSSVNVPTRKYSWTRDSEQSNLTGESRECHYVYTAYKIEKDEYGRYILIPSNTVSDLTTIMEEYPYIKEDYYKAVDRYGNELDYEDGPQTISKETDCLQEKSIYRI